MNMVKKKNQHHGSGKQERFIQPSILMGLLEKPTYGYELINKIQAYGFFTGQAPPGMIYRHLRQLEEDGMVTSQWETQGAGAAKRMYTITAEGKDMLSAWIDFMNAQADKLKNFIEMYKSLTSI